MGNGTVGSGASKLKSQVAKKQPSAYNPNTKSLRSIYDAHLKITGPITGTLYEWLKPGDVVYDIPDEDADLLLAKRIGGKGCCGGKQEGNQLFELA